MRTLLFFKNKRKEKVFMSKTNFSQIVRSVRESVSRHSPEILTGLGIAGMITAGVLAVKETPKALRLIDAKKKEQSVDKLTVKDTVKTTWKCYISPVALAGVSTACLIGSSKVSSRRNAALATAYKISETALTEYREKVIETIGEKKERAIRESVAKDHIEMKPISSSEIYITGGGDTYFYDHTSDRYFTADLERIRRAVNNLNESMINGIDPYVSLNDFYDEIGLRYTLVGNEVGWNVSKWGSIKLDFHAQIADNGKPCLVLDFSQNPPRRDYDKLM
jgi:hypothetical protein